MCGGRVLFHHLLERAALGGELFFVGVGHVRGDVGAVGVARVGGVVPHALGHWRPLVGEGAALAAQMLGAFLFLQVSAVRAGANGHVREHPAEQRSLLDHPVDELLAAYAFGVCAGHARGNAERQVVGAQQLHGGGYLVVRALAAPRVRCLTRAFGADGRHEVADAQQVLAEVLVDERGVRETQKRAIGVRLAQADKVVLAHERLAAGVDVDVEAQRHALVDDVVDFLVVEVELVAVLGGPAAGAMQVARVGGVKQDGPGNVALVLVAYFSSGILGLFSQWVVLDSELPLEYLSKLATATVGGGVSALVKAAGDLRIDELSTAPVGV